jgi:iron-sulfur cluster repair protein YtfE (RIC family)
MIPPNLALDLSRQHQRDLISAARRRSPRRANRATRSALKVTNILDRFTIAKAATHDTRLAHDLYRRATSLLADASGSGHAANEPLAELRDFVVTDLRYHQKSEDGLVWPLLTSANPGAAEALDALSAEHHLLASALHMLERVIIARPPERGSLARAAQAVRDILHAHLDNEESILMPLLAVHISDSHWARLRRQIAVNAPTEHMHLKLCLLDEVASPTDVADAMSALPPIAGQSNPAIRRRARHALANLNGVI